MTFLSDQERTQLRAQHKRERGRRICDRIKAALLYDKGWSVSAIAEASLLSDNAIREHIAEYKNSQKLKPENGGSIISRKRKVHVFCDNAPYYRNKAVKNYLITSKIMLHFLPPYSPNLNPIERLWKWMKERIIYNTYYEHFEDFKAAIFGFFTVLSTVAVEPILGQSLRNRVRDKFRTAQALVPNF